MIDNDRHWNISPLVWRIEPLPDFLGDHTLPGETTSARLHDIVSRWIQWLGSLSGWQDKACFALRFVARDGRVSVCLMARPDKGSDRPLLAREIGILLRAHRLGNGEPLSPTETWEAVEDAKLDDMHVLQIRQHETRDLWRLPSSLDVNEHFRQEFQWLPELELKQPRVIYPWKGPGGPFLVPMESLISQSVPVTLTAYLRPTRLKRHEWLWLAAMAREAQSKGERQVHQVGAGASTRVVDPSANLAGRLYMENLRRLSTSPFLVSVHCASQGRREAARAVAGAMQALLQQTPFEAEGEESQLPTGAMVRAPEDIGEDERHAVQVQYDTLGFPAPSQSDPLARLPYLANARGAATAFRLPISVRGGVPGIRVRQLPPDFHPGRRENASQHDHLDLGAYHVGGRARVPVRDLTKHVLICGFTGSGKTVTVLQILHQLWCDHGVPFLVLESAKQEYRGFLGVKEFQDTLRVFTLGNETATPLRINPFELLPGVRVEAHLNKLQTCFEGAIPPVGPSSSVIAEALLRVYEDKGWRLTDTYATSGVSRRTFPVLSEFVSTVETIIDDRGYQGDVRSNIRAALVGRLQPLLFGSRGRMFDVQRSFPSPNELFAYPTVLEMNDLNLDDKALVVMFLLTLLREYREQNPGAPGRLAHATVVEEAHNVLENVSSAGQGEGATSADTRFKAVQAFCSLLTEIRALGEGLIIADQSPEKLARDALRNTNLQLAHQLRDGDDRDAVARAMIMETEQRDYLGKLPPGEAAVFRTGLEKATFVRIDKYYPTADDALRRAGETKEQAVERCRRTFRGFGFAHHLSDSDVVQRMKTTLPEISSAGMTDLPLQACQQCRSQCEFRDAAFAQAACSTTRTAADEWFPLVNSEKRKSLGVSAEEMWRRGMVLTLQAADEGGLTRSIDAAWCQFSHIWDDLMRRNQWKDQNLDGDCRRLLETHYRRLTQPSPPQEPVS